MNLTKKFQKDINNNDEKEIISDLENLKEFNVYVHVFRLYNIRKTSYINDANIPLHIYEYIRNDINSIRIRGVSLIVWAYKNNNLNLFRYLIDNGYASEQSTREELFTWALKKMIMKHLTIFYKMVLT